MPTRAQVIKSASSHFCNSLMACLTLNITQKPCVTGCVQLCSGLHNLVLCSGLHNLKSQHIYMQTPLSCTITGEKEIK